jgi:glycosyltransferase involved in cell wall biosynthesis
MRLFLVTQAVDQNDPVLGFFHRWLIEFAKHVESLTVICLYEGTHQLPSNVRVYSLGKEGGPRSPLTYAWRFLQLAWQLREEYDSVFVHMNSEYLVIAGLLWKVLGKRTALWYLHKSVTWRLRVGALFADHIFTASAGSLRLKTGKKRIVGHGIDLTHIALSSPPAYPPLSLLTVGRLSPIKRVDVLLQAFAELHESGIEAQFTIVGAGVGAEGKKYEEELKRMADALGVGDHALFKGSMPHAELPTLFAQTHLFIHASDTGSLDKASLEPLAAGVPLITAHAELEEAGCAGITVVPPTAAGFTGAIRQAIGKRIWDDIEVRRELRAYVLANHELTRLIPRILAIMAQ